MKQGRVNQDLVSATDFLPTICEATHVEVPSNIDGVSFLPQLLGEKGTPREWLYSWYSPRQTQNLNVREFAFDHGHKLYRTGQFFDLVSDPFEKTPVEMASADEKQKLAHSKLQTTLSKFDNARPVALDRQFAQETPSEKTDSAKKKKTKKKKKK
jgi:arylsulfatase A